MFLGLILSALCGLILSVICLLIVFKIQFSIFTKTLILIAIFITTSVTSFFFVWKPWAWVDVTDLGYVYDARYGTVSVLPHTGYVARDPIFQFVHVIDKRPKQVCINIGTKPDEDGVLANKINQRVLNCKLVQFNPNGLQLFLSWHGRGDYTDGNLPDLLKIYAYDGSGKTYPFLNVLEEVKPTSDYTSGGK